MDKKLVNDVHSWFQGNVIPQSQLPSAPYGALTRDIKDNLRAPQQSYPDQYNSQLPRLLDVTTSQYTGILADHATESVLRSSASVRLNSYPALDISNDNKNAFLFPYASLCNMDQNNNVVTRAGVDASESTFRSTYKKLYHTDSQTTTNRQQEEEISLASVGSFLKQSASRLVGGIMPAAHFVQFGLQVDPYHGVDGSASVIHKGKHLVHVQACQKRSTPPVDVSVETVLPSNKAIVSQHLMGCDFNGVALAQAGVNFHLGAANVSATVQSRPPSMLVLKRGVYRVPSEIGLLTAGMDKPSPNIVKNDLGEFHSSILSPSAITMLDTPLLHVDATMPITPQADAQNPYTHAHVGARVTASGKLFHSKRVGGIELVYAQNNRYNQFAVECLDSGRAIRQSGVKHVIPALQQDAFKSTIGSNSNSNSSNSNSSTNNAYPSLSISGAVTTSMATLVTAQRKEFERSSYLSARQVQEARRRDATEYISSVSPKSLDSLLPLAPVSPTERNSVLNGQTYRAQAKACIDSQVHHAELTATYRHNPQVTVTGSCTTNGSLSVGCLLRSNPEDRVFHRNSLNTDNHIQNLSLDNHNILASLIQSPAAVRLQADTTTSNPGNVSLSLLLAVGDV